MRDSKPCHPCLKAFEAAEKHENEKIRKLVDVLNWRGRNSTSSSFEFKVRGKGIQVRQVMGGEHDTSKRLMEQPACKEKDFLDGLGTGATCWPASLVLTKFLEKQWMHIYNRLQKSNKLYVVELGAGCGLVGIACQILGAHFVLCTDGAAEVVDLTRNNISANGHLFENRRGIKACSYRWGEDGNSEINDIAEKVNLIVCSDCVLPKLFPIAPLVHALDRLMSRETECYLSYEDRYFEEYHPREKFIMLAEMKGLMVEVLPMSELDEVYSVEDIEIWRVTRKY